MEKEVLLYQQRVFDMTMRWIYKEEFRLLLKLAGFTEWELYGDFDKSRYSYESQEMMIWIVKKR